MVTKVVKLIFYSNLPLELHFFKVQIVFLAIVIFSSWCILIPDGVRNVVILVLQGTCVYQMPPRLLWKRLCMLIAYEL